MKRGSALALATVGACLLLAFRPVPEVDRAVAALVSVLGLPYQIFGDVEVLLRERTLGASVRSDPARAAYARAVERELADRERQAAGAASPDLASGGGLLAEVLGRDLERDTIVIGRGADAGIVPGLAVTAGDDLVGVIASVSSESATVRLVSHPAFRAAAETQDGRAVRLVVAGSGRGEARVEVAARRDLAPGIEIRAAAMPDGDALDPAVGFRIGRLAAAESGARAFSVVPRADVDRLLRVAIRTGAAGSMPADAVAPPTRYERIDLCPGADSHPGRATLLARARRGAAAALGAAVQLDGCLVGRVARRGGPTLRVRCVEDPGFEIDAIWLPEGRPPVFVGPVRNVGRQDGAIALAPAGRPVDLPAATGPLVTGNREETVPKGLLLGVARLVGGRLLLQRPFDGRCATSALVASEVAP